MHQISERPETTTTPASEAIAALLDTVSKPDQPGAAILAARNGEIIFRGAYGLANVELSVPIVPSMIFRLASITKQFTTMAIMILVEQGRLRLEDDLATLLPDYPPTDQRITLEHLMTHTSGIKSYTSMPEWRSLVRNDITLEDLIAIFKDQPLEFMPGERWSYNNSGYILLASIIERVSGQSYEQFLREHIFEPLGMQHTSVDRSERLVHGRVSGYEQGPDGLQNASFLSMTHPHAAGALISTVDDLLVWDEALYTERLVSRAMLERAHTPFVLDDATSSGYGYGWGVYDYDGDHVVAHSGGINGFKTYALRMPNDHVYVAVLMNSTGTEPQAAVLAMKIARIVLGKPSHEPDAIVLEAEALNEYVGVYAGPRNEDFLVRREDDHLMLVHHGGAHHTLFPSAVDIFFERDSFIRLHFRRDQHGAISGLALYDLDPVEHAARTDRPLPPERVVIELDSALLERYKGVYELRPNVVATIAGDTEQLTVQMPGQEAVPIFPESETVFFLKIVEALIVFEMDDQGGVVALELDQGGRKHRAVKKALP